jgi:hypothetical protein
MIRCRFRANPQDPRPVLFPPPHPYWVTGYGDNYAIVVAYAEDETQILKFWPEAVDLDSTQASEYIFTDRFQKPAWFTTPPTAASP